MVEQTAIIQNGQGIHCRPSAMIIKHTAGYEGRIRLKGERGETHMHSVIELMALELFPGSQVTVCVEGPDEERVCQEIVLLLETHFDFPPEG